MQTVLAEAQKIEILRLRNEDLSIRQISAATGIPKSTIGDFLKKDTYKEWWGDNEKPIAGGDLYDHRENLSRIDGNTFIITSAQNNTFVHNQFLASLEVMADRLGAKILVGTFSYNKNGFQNLEKSEGEWFDPKIKDYILDEPALLADDLLWCGELNILPTAVNPLSGLHSYTKNMSGIVPHAKVQLESLPTHKTEPTRMLYTTGTVTKRNYIQKKSGQKASFHHIFGALVVTVDKDGDWFVRQLIADSETGYFYDLDTLYTPTGYHTNQRVEAVNWGDIHIEKFDLDVWEASVAENGKSILDVLKPRYQFIHDVLDFEARNHHNISDPYFRFKLHRTEKDNVERNIMSVVSFLHDVEREYSVPVVVESNHDLAFQRWLKEADYKSDPENAIYFLENQLEMYKAIERGDFNFSIFEHAVKKFDPDMKTIFLRVDESFKICNGQGNGIECGSHGHIGTNGSRGSVSTFIKLGTRYNVGHSHTAAIRDGVYYAGVSGKLDMEYNKGASSWSHSHIITYPNGKRAIVTLKNGKWR